MALNTYALVTILILFNVFTGFIITNTLAYSSVTTITTNVDTLMDINNNIVNTQSDSSHIIGDNDIDKRAGDDFKISYNLFDILKYGFAPISLITNPSTTLESYLVIIMQIISALITTYASITLYFIIKNRSTQ